MRESGNISTLKYRLEKKGRKESGIIFQRCPRIPTTNNVLYLDIKAVDYKNPAEILKISTLFVQTVCPSCKSLGGWKVHGQYNKYHNNEYLLIVRLRCRLCAHTHAIIPSFSLPHTCLDTKMVQTYLARRNEGDSRMVAARASGFSSYCGLEFLRSLEKRFAAAVYRAKVLYPSWGNEHESGYRWMTIAANELPDALFVLNERAIAFNGQSFFGGNVRTGLRPTISGIVISHKNASRKMAKSSLDSG